MTIHDRNDLGIETQPTTIHDPRSPLPSSLHHTNPSRNHSTYTKSPRPKWPRDWNPANNDPRPTVVIAFKPPPHQP